MARNKQKGWGTSEIILLVVIVLLCIAAAALGYLALSNTQIVVFGNATPTQAVVQSATATPISEDVPGDFSGESDGNVASNAQIFVNPAAGSPGSTVKIEGQDFPVNSRVVVYLVPKNPPNFALNSAVTDENGRFSVEIIVPSDARWLDESPVPVLAEAVDTGVKAQGQLTVMASTNQPAATPVTVEIIVVGNVDVTPPPPPPPKVPQLTATANVNIRGGPGTNYPILGVLLNGQMAEITGRTADATWWQIKFTGTSDGRGWIAAAYASAVNIGNVPVVTAPSPPPSPSPTPTPNPGVTITDWRGEYWTNKNLAGPPALIRNDPAVNFDWDLESPDPAIPVDYFSARWTRRLFFAAGTYRFYTRTDDGVRLFIDGALLIDKWVIQSPTTYAADVYLSEGTHEIRMDYFEETGGAVAILSWQRVEYASNWQAEYYNNTDLRGNPALIRSEPAINYNWGAGSPAPGSVNSDNFAVRWTRQIYFETGDYTFRVRSDDGVRIWVDNDLVFDNWRDGDSGWLEARRSIPAGGRLLRVEYYEHTGNAFIAFSWFRSDTPPNPPLAVIKAPSEAVAGQSITFDGSRSREGNYRVVSYEWDFGNGKKATGKKVNYTYNQAGEYKVRLKVRDEIGLTDTSDVKIKITKNPTETTPPIAVINGPSTGKVNVSVRFDGRGSTSLTPIVRYDWNFGDGIRASGLVQDHVYTRADTYDVSLTVVAANGLRDTQEISIRIDDNVSGAEKPEAHINAPTSGQVGQPILFDGTQSDAGVDRTLTDYKWDFGDGSVANAPNVEHTYSSPGSYIIKLEVINDKGLSHSTSQVLNIVAQPPPQPQPEIVAPTEVTVNEQVRFTTNVIPNGQYEYAWNFGDGTEQTTGQTDIAHVYDTAGNYNVLLTVTDANGRSGTTQKSITVKNLPPPPQPEIIGPDTVTVGDTATFTANDKRDPDNTTPIADYIWDFGPVQQLRAASEAPQVTVNITFEQPGPHNVKLTMVDTLGRQGSASKTVTVENQPTPPPGAAEPPQARISGPDTATVSEPVAFDASNSVMGSSPISRIEWDFGDETAGSSGSVLVEHTYEQTGSYTVTLTLIDDLGLGDTATKTITVEAAAVGPPGQPPETGNPPLAAFSINPTRPVVGEEVTFDGGYSDGESPIVSWQWDFGDGDRGSGMGATHTYAASGRYPVILTVTDAQGRQNTSAPLYVEVAEATQPEQPPPTGTPTPLPTNTPTLTPTVTPTLTPTVTATLVPTITATLVPTVTTTPVPTDTPPPGLPIAVFQYEPPTPVAGQPAIFDAGFSRSSVPIRQYRWDFGDGQIGQGMGVTHVYTISGQFTVTLMITDANRLQSNPSTRLLVVNPPAPQPSNVEPPPPPPGPVRRNSR